MSFDVFFPSHQILQLIFFLFLFFFFSKYTRLGENRAVREEIRSSKNKFRKKITNILLSRAIYTIVHITRQHIWYLVHVYRYVLQQYLVPVYCCTKYCFPRHGCRLMQTRPTRSLPLSIATPPRIGRPGGRTAAVLLPVSLCSFCLRQRLDQGFNGYGGRGTPKRFIYFLCTCTNTSVFCFKTGWRFRNI